MTGSPQDLLDLYFRARAVAFRYRLDTFQDEALKDMLATFDEARAEILREINAKLDTMSDFRKERLSALLEYTDEVTAGIRKELGGKYAEMSATVATPAMVETASALSVGGLSKVAVSMVELSPTQLRAFFQSTPLGGRLIDRWVDASFDATVQRELRKAINTGIVQGEGYAKLNRRALQKAAENGINLARRESITLTRTFVSAANTEARDMVYRQNRDIIKGYVWQTMGDNLVCHLCLPLHGREFKLGEGPEQPRHPSCRCVKRPVSLTFREMGIDMDEFGTELDRWVVRGKVGKDGELIVKNIDVGGKNEILKISRAKTAEEWLKSLSPAELRSTTLGPTRLSMLQQGKIELKHLLRPDFTYRTIPELEAIADAM